MKSPRDNTLYLSLEMKAGLHNLLPSFEQGGISVLWALFAIAYIGFGIAKSVTLLRHVGLVLFVIVVGKAFLLDLDHIDGLYRVGAFMALGVFLLLGSFAYVYSQKKFVSSGGEDQLATPAG